MYPLLYFILFNNWRVFFACAVVSPWKTARVGRLLPTVLPPDTVFSYTATPALFYHHHHCSSSYCRSTRRSRTKATQRPATARVSVFVSSSTTANRGLLGRRVGTAYYYRDGLGAEERRRGSSSSPPSGLVRACVTVSFSALYSPHRSGLPHLR